MPEIGTSGLMSGDEKQGGSRQYLRSSSTLLRYSKRPSFSNVNQREDKSFSAP